MDESSAVKADDSQILEPDVMDVSMEVEIDEFEKPDITDLLLKNPDITETGLDETSNSPNPVLRKSDSTESELSRPGDEASSRSDSDAEMPSAKSEANSLSSAGKETPSRKARRTKERPSPQEQPQQKLNWKLNLRILISNLYMKSEERLPGACVPKCLHNSPQCVDKHRCSMLPDAPNFVAVQALRTTLHGQHYDTFLDILETMVLQCVYPGEGVFDRLIDMTMILIAKDISVKELAETYNKLIRTFYLLVDAFPPCWTALRPYYLNFLGIRNPSLREKRSNSETPQKLQFYLDLFEENLSQCNEEEIRENTKFYERYEFNFSEEEDANMSQETVFLRHVQQYDWLSGKLCLDDFKKMSASVRLARLCDVLNMLTWVLEYEFLTWLEHNRLRQSESEMFQEDTRPFVAIVFQMTASTRLTDIVKQVMKLYGIAAAKSMYPERLRILQRLIALIVEVSNTAELKYVDNAVIYPNLGPQTRLLISDFFKIFKSQNPKHISTYLKIIPQLDHPYLRFEFTDHFLQLFYFPKKLPFCPEKVCNEFTDRNWLKYTPRSAIEEEEQDEQLSREDYLRILLNALVDYDKWLNLAGFWKCLKTKQSIMPLQTRTSSTLATPVGMITGGQGKVFMLDEMEKEVHTWKKRMNTKMILGRPEVHLPVARVNVSKMCLRYGEDVRYLRLLRRVLKNDIQKELDVADWMTYLNGVLGDDDPISRPVSTAETDSSS